MFLYSYMYFIYIYICIACNNERITHVKPIYIVLDCKYQPQLLPVYMELYITKNLSIFVFPLFIIK